MKYFNNKELKKGKKKKSIVKRISQTKMVSQTKMGLQTKKTSKNKRNAVNKRKTKLKRNNGLNVKSKKQIGGEKLGEGGYGCVVKPSIPCRFSKKKYPNAVSKIVHTKYDSGYEDELEIYKKIRIIDPHQKHLISFYEECSIHSSDVANRYPKDVLTAKLSDNSNNDSFSLIGDDIRFSNQFDFDDLDKKFCKLDMSKKPRNQVQPYGGYEFKSLLKTKDKNMLTLLKQNYKKIIYNLLIGVYKMHQKKIVHRDIKGGNILVLISKKRKSKKYTKHHRNNKDSYEEFPLARHIDFGLSEDLSYPIKRDIYDVHQQGTPGYIPIDIVILSKLKEIRRSRMDGLDPNIKKTILSIYNYYKSSMADRYSRLNLSQSFINITNKPLLGVNKKTYIELNNISDMYDKYIKLVMSDKFESVYFKKYDGIVYKSDIFALGLEFRNLQNRLEIKDKKFELLIKKMCQIDPDYRPNIKDCIKNSLFKTKTKTKNKTKTKK